MKNKDKSAVSNPDGFETALNFSLVILSYHP